MRTTYAQFCAYRSSWNAVCPEVPLMTAPRQVIPGTTYMVTRRCSQRQFLLRPSKEVNQVFLYLLAYSSNRFSVDVHAYCVLSNHYHLIVTDRLGNLPAFMQLLNCLVARALNAYYRRSENMWSPGSYNAVALVGEEDVIDKLIYVLSNPVEAGLVSHGEHWPGLRSSPRDFGSHRAVEQPSFFFQPDGDAPDRAILSISSPPRHEGSSEDEFMNSIEEKLDAREAELRIRQTRKGREFLGAKSVLKQSIQTQARSTDAGSRRKQIVPRFACREKQKRVEALARYRQFLREYRDALRDFCGGLRNVVFPYGTYWMRVQFAVQCASMPP